LRGVFALLDRFSNPFGLLLSHAFAWIRDGPIERLFKSRLQADFFRYRFDKENELLLLANGRFSDNVQWSCAPPR
jgi:hypothetical protein